MFKGSVCFPGILSFDCLLLKLKNIKTNRLFFLNKKCAMVDFYPAEQ